MNKTAKLYYDKILFELSIKLDKDALNERVKSHYEHPLSINYFVESIDLFCDKCKVTVYEVEKETNNDKTNFLLTVSYIVKDEKRLSESQRIVQRLIANYIYKDDILTLRKEIIEKIGLETYQEILRAYEK